MDTNVGGLTVKDYGQQVPASEAQARAELEKRYGQVWDTTELQRDFDVVGFCAPCVVAIRKSDGVKGSLEFSHNPRFYFDFR